MGRNMTWPTICALFLLTWAASSAAAEAGKPWAVACDEPGDASHALRPDRDAGNSHEDGRKNGLWGTLMAGGWGNEWYFGYKHAHLRSTPERTGTAGNRTQHHNSHYIFMTLHRSTTQVRYETHLD